jgi:DNA-directed RNA polymerase specialized sigma24 family protein
VTQVSVDSWPPWDSLSSAFKDHYRVFDPSVYETAGEIWLRAVDFAKKRNGDESMAYDALMTAVGTVSNVSPDTIKSLPNYLFTAYKHCLFDELEKADKLAGNTESLGDGTGALIDAGAAIEKRILLEEIVALMDPETLRIYEGLILGYTYEDLAKKIGSPANSLRSRFSKRVRQIAAELTPNPVKLTD